MNNNNFRFNKILEINKMKLDNEKTKLQQLQERSQQIKQMIDSKKNSLLVAQHKADSEEFLYDPRIHSMQLQYVESLENELVALVSLGEKADEALKLQQDALANAFKEFKTFEKMKEYHEDSVKEELNKYDQKLIDEHNSIQHTQRKHLEGDA